MDRRRGPAWQRFIIAPRSATLRYGVAVLLSVLSLALANWLKALEAVELTSLAFASVVLSAIYGGLGPALLDTAITAIGVDYFFAPPIHRVFDSWSSLLRVLIYGGVGFVVAEVVSSLRDAYRSLREEHRQTKLAKRAREDVLGMVSHDLRSPLSSVLLNAEYLRREAADRLPAELHGAAEGILRSGRQMQHLIDDLLDAVRIENGQLRIDPGEHDLAQIATRAVEQARPAAQAKGVRLSRAIAPGDYRLRCDALRMTQVLDNLLGNAVKFSPDGAMVQLELRSSASQLELVVTDWGPGIAPEDLPRVFERYWQAESGAYKGTGLGLFITKSLVDAHGGRIQVDSRPGRGAAFTIYLLRASASDASETPRPTSPSRKK